MISLPRMSEHCDSSGFYWDRIVTMSDGTTRVRPVSPVTFNKLVCIEIGRARAPAKISSVPENPRILAQCQALEFPTVPQSLAIPQTEIASYPRKWRDSTCSGKYSYIPSYMGWR